LMHASMERHVVVGRGGRDAAARAAEPPTKLLPTPRGFGSTNQPTNHTPRPGSTGASERARSPPCVPSCAVSRGREWRSRSGEHALTRWRALREAMTRRLARNRRRHNPPPGRESALALVRTPHDPHARPHIHTTNLLHSAVWMRRWYASSEHALVVRAHLATMESLPIDRVQHRTNAHALTRSLGLTLLG